MRKYLFATLFWVLGSVAVHATQFVPLSIEKQIEEADFAVEATLDSKRVHKNASGQIMTEYTFVVNEGFGFNEPEFHLEIPGGTIDGVTSMIEGGPRFEEKSKVFLLLKNVESKIYLSNFTLGEYHIVEIDGKSYYRSEVFSHDPRIGIISKEKMQSLMKEKWQHTSLVPNPSPKNEQVVTNIPVEIKSHDIVRIPTQVEELEKTTLSTPLIFLISFIIVFALWIVIRRKQQ